MSTPPMSREARELAIDDDLPEVYYGAREQLDILTVESDGGKDSGGRRSIGHGCVNAPSDRQGTVSCDAAQIIEALKGFSHSD